MLFKYMNEKEFEPYWPYWVHIPGQGWKVMTKYRAEMCWQHRPRKRCDVSFHAAIMWKVSEHAKLRKETDELH